MSIQTLAGQNSTMLTNGTYFEAYPSLKEPTSLVSFVASIFLCCFVVGICGNASTLTLIFGFGTVQRQKTTPKLGQATHDRFKVYVASLCFTDILMLLSLPSAIVDSLIGFWIFGNAACKFHHFCSTVGRLASTLIITSLSIERYLAVVSPQRFGSRSRRTTALIMFLLIALATILLLPLIIFAKAERVFLFESRQGPNIVHVRIFKCTDSMPTNLLFWFTGSTFFVGYFCPMILISTFSIKLLLEIRRHQRKLKKSTIPTKRVTIYIVVIASLYFACWGPYWISVLYVSYIDIFESRAIKTLTNSSEHTMLLIYCAHILPYLNTAINWLLYGRLARNLTTQQSSSTMLYRNGGAETTSFTRHLVDNNTQSEFSWTRKQTLEEGSLFFGAAPNQHPFIRSLQSNSVEFKLSNGRHTVNHDDIGHRQLTKYEEEIENFETL